MMKPLFQECLGVSFRCFFFFSLTDVPYVGVEAHVFGSFLELQAGISPGELPVAVRMPGQAGDRALHLVRIPAHTEGRPLQTRDCPHSSYSVKPNWSLVLML